MKIICVDNYDRQMYPDELICENISETIGEEVVNFLNKTRSGSNSEDFYQLVENGHKLFNPYE
jgi:hypothetical protein